MILAHLHGTDGFPAAIPPWVFDHGVLGVRIFFVISGFLITRLIVQEVEATGRLSLKLFYARRALRIFPAFYVYLAIVAFAAWLGWLDIPLSNLAAGATYTMNYVVNGRWETGHLWSLAVEEQFYLLWPFAICTLGIRRALILAALLAVGAPYGLLALFLHGARLYMQATTTFPFVFDGIAAGCVLGGWLDALRRQPAFERAIHSAYGEVVPLAVLVLDCVDHHSFLYHAVVQLATTVGICYVIARYSQVSASAGARVLASPFLEWTGRRSYSLYLWQQLFLDPYHHTPLQMLPMNVVCAFACAAASYQFIELPLNALRRRYRPGSRAQVTQGHLATGALR